jgi:hypothetical protein
MTVIAGIPIPSNSPLFLAVVGLHVLLGLACTIIGMLAMLRVKGRGRHSDFGTIYYWCLSGVSVTALGLSVVRWDEDYHLAILAALSFGSAYLGRRAIRHRWRNWPVLHLWGMGASYILLITAFYVDNGKNLPLWRDLPQIAFWIFPTAIGVPLILYVKARHPLMQTRPTPQT